MGSCYLKRQDGEIRYDALNDKARNMLMPYRKAYYMMVKEHGIKFQFTEGF